MRYDSDNKKPGEGPRKHSDLDNQSVSQGLPQMQGGGRGGNW